MDKKYELYKKILDIENVITVVLDKDANIVLINRKGSMVLGDAKRNITGINWIENFIPSKERKEVKKIFSRVISGELKGADYYENHILTKDGKTLLVAWHNSYIYGDDGTLIYTVSSGDDITEKRKLEEALAIKNAELEKTLEELKITQKQLLQKERMQVVGQFSAGIAHHFNNLLTGILGNAEILGMDSSVQEKHSKELGQIIQAGTRAAVLVQKMLDFSRKSPAQSHNFDLPSLLRGITAKIKRSLPKNVLLNINIKCRECRTIIDPIKFEQILLNLISNSVDSMEDDGKIEITLNRARISNKVTCSMCGGKIEGSWLILKIKDSGQGIPKDIMPHIFEPFFTTRGFGKGLGLSQVFGIVEQFKGHLTVENMENRETTITIYLPVE